MPWGSFSTRWSRAGRRGGFSFPENEPRPRPRPRPCRRRRVRKSHRRPLARPVGEGRFRLDRPGPVPDERPPGRSDDQRAAAFPHGQARRKSGFPALSAPSCRRTDRRREGRLGDLLSGRRRAPVPIQPHGYPERKAPFFPRPRQGGSGREDGRHREAWPARHGGPGRRPRIFDRGLESDESSKL